MLQFILFRGHKHLLCRMEIELRIIEIDFGENDTDESLCLVQTILEGFHILRGRIPAAIRRLIVRAF